MISKKFLIALAISCIIMQEISAACVCNEKGTDYCETCSEHLVVRPKQKYYEKSDLAPIGDNCWCSKLMIEPATLPKPCPKQKKNEPCGCQACKNQNSYGSSTYNFPSYATTNTAYKKDDSPAADPISVSLAVQAGHAIGVPEAKLSYGYVQKPVDGMKKVYFSSVPEENLYKIKNDIITLQKRPITPQKEEEEYIEPEEDDNESDDNGDGPPKLTYKQLGYVTETYKNPKFRQVKPQYGDSYVIEEKGNAIKDKVKVDCGFKPGRISPYRKVGYELNDCY